MPIRSLLGVEQGVLYRSTALFRMGVIDTASLRGNHRHVIRRAAGSHRRKEIIAQAKLLGVAPVIGNIRLGVLNKATQWKLIHLAAIDSSSRRSRTVAVVVAHWVGGVLIGVAIDTGEASKHAIER